MKCPLSSSFNLVAPRGDCSTSLSNKLQVGTDNGLNINNCVSETSGTNGSGQTYCSLAVNGGCAMVIVFGDTTAQQRLQNRDELIAIIGNTDRFCFALCDGSPVEVSRIQGLDGNNDVRVCVMTSESGAGADC